jgi:hypothetical protein
MWEEYRTSIPLPTEVLKKNSTGINSAERDIISCEELAESTNVTTEVASDKQLRLNNVEREQTSQAKVTNFFYI